jgi:monoamine oxidase
LAASRQGLKLPDIPLSVALTTVFRSLPPLTARQRELFGISQSWFIRAATGSDPENISLYNTMAYLSAGETDRAFPKGYRQVAEVLAKHIDIRLGHPIQAIDYRTNVIKVLSRHRVFTARRVVVTLPIGVLQSGGVTFIPDLPASKRGAIARARLGVVNKLFLEFPERFWDDNPVLLMRGSGASGRWPVFLNFGKVVGPPILMAFNSGSAGLATESLSTAALVAQARSALQTMFARTIPAPVKTLRSAWFSDPYSRGSYPFFPIGSHLHDREEIGKPVNSRLFFAGDGTRNEDAEVRGAFSSGIRVVDEILAS